MKLYISRGNGPESKGDVFFEFRRPKDDDSKFYSACYKEFRKLTRIKLKQGEYVEINVGKPRRWDKRR